MRSIPLGRRREVVQEEPEHREIPRLGNAFREQRQNLGLRQRDFLRQGNPVIDIDPEEVGGEEERAQLDDRRWCADAGRPTRFKPSSPSPTDAVRDGSTKLGHPVQNGTREHGLTPLPR